MLVKREEWKRRFVKRSGTW